MKGEMEMTTKEKKYQRSSPKHAVDRALDGSIDSQKDCGWVGRRPARTFCAR
jgi:hypothetical protein